VFIVSGTNYTLSVDSVHTTNHSRMMKYRNIQ